MMKKYNDFNGVPYSSHIDMENIFNIKINNPIANMQNDDADFEALAIALKCKNPNSKILIQFDENKTRWNGRFDTTDADINAYLRFLFRVIKFQEAFPEWVEISSQNKEVVEKFKNKLEQAKEDLKISNNIPDEEASEWNENMQKEKDIETKFTHTKEGIEYLKELCSQNNSKIELTDIIFNQLPNGLFNIANDERPRKNKRIFPTGYYDIWSIDKKGNLCVFELKKDEGNESLGVISELFFYAVYAKEFLCDKRFLHEPNKDENFRGYEKLYNAVKNDEIKDVKAIFLLGKGIHSVIQELREKIIKLLNTNKLGIQFIFTEYDIERIDRI